MNVKTITECAGGAFSPKTSTASTAESAEQQSPPSVSDDDDDESLTASTTTSKNPIPAPFTSSLMSMVLAPATNHSSPHQCRLRPRKNPRVVSPCAKNEEKERTCLVYLIRHGEAEHNVLEKAAKQRAKDQAEANGLSPEQVQECMEQARVAVLTDENLRDANLSVEGREDAERARHRLNDLVELHGLSAPSKVLVSPLSRTLETADLIFPHHDTIQVREEIQERQTGKPCDCRRSSSALATMPPFRRFQMEALRQSSFLSSNQDSSCYTSSDNDSSSEEEEEEGQHHPFSSSGKVTSSSHRWKSDCRHDRPHQALDRRPSDVIGEEDKATLRVRTQKLLGLLDEPSIAVVTHKGYLRELERGTLGQPDAKEFDNGEIRVYRINLDTNQALEKAERIV